MKVSLPSFNEIATESLATFRRFPVVMSVALIGTAVAIWLADLSYEKEKDYYWLYNIAFQCGLSISFFIALTIYGESRGGKRNTVLTVNAIGLSMVAIYAFTFPEVAIYEAPVRHFYQYLLFFLASHLFVSFSPFLNSSDINEFWGYNKVLLLNLLTSALYSVVLFVGLSIALLSIDVLLEINIDANLYLQLWFFLVGVFNTWFFLSRVPKPGAFQPGMTDYPTGLKVFVQYVLIPLVTVYIFILYLYIAKIIIQWELPKGWVANLVLSFSIAGILSLLLLYPIQHQEKNKWMRVYSRSYFYGLILLLVLLFVSIWTRISEYGVTINRFFVATLAVWLAGIVIYFVTSKTKNIKVIPISLCIIALGISFGPIGAFSVSERSQLGRFEKMLGENQMLDDNGQVIIREEKNGLPFDTRKQLSSKVQYLVGNHGLSGLQEYFSIDLEKDLSPKEDEITGYNPGKSEQIVSLLGFEFVQDWQTEETDTLSTRYFEFNAAFNTVLDIESYVYAIQGLRFLLGVQERRISLEDDIYLLELDYDTYVFSLKNESNKKSISIGIKDFVEGLKRKYPGVMSNREIPLSEMTITSENENYSILLAFNYIYENVGEDEGLSNVQLNVYFTIKE